MSRAAPDSPAGSQSELIPVSLEDDAKSNFKMPVVFTLAPLLIGFAIAEGIHRGTGYDMYVSVIETDLKPRRLYWLYFGAVITACLTTFINSFPMGFKNAAMEAQGKQAKGNIRANMYLYESTSRDVRPVVLMEEGAAGKYNRANRSLHHYVENMGGFLLCLPLAGFVYPAASFVLAILFAIGRLAHQIGYTKGYGGHGAGFGIAMIATVILEGLVLVAGMRAVGVPL